MPDVLKTGEIITDPNITKLFSSAAAPIAIYKGRELRYVFVNDAYAEIFNHRQILGKTVREAFPELEGQHYFEILEKVFDTGEPYYGSETPAMIDLNNTGELVERYYNLVYTPYKNEEGKTEGVMAFGHDITEQIVARQKEKESDARFKNIVEQSTDPILILKGEQLTLEVANDALFKLWKVDKDSLGKPFLDILPEMKDQIFHDMLLDVYHNGTKHYGYEAEAYFKRSNGTIEKHYFNFIYQPYKETDGKISGVMVSATDVTGQVLAKQELTQSEIRFRNMIVQAPVAMCVLKGQNYELEIANEKMYELMGKPEKELLAKPIFEGLPEARDQGLEALLDEVFTTGNTFKANERPVQLPRNGVIETTYLNFAYEPYKNGDGKISGIIVVGIDVTDQVIARRKIEYAEENARLAIESADLGTYEINLLTDEIIASPRFREIWQIEGEESREGFASVIHPHDKALREQAMKESVDTGKLHYEARIIRKDGSIKWLRVKGKVLYDKQNVPQRLLGVIQDITPQKLFAEELYKQVEERTKALQDANQNLERSNEELDQFAYVASHDLQEPLRKIHIFNSIVLSQPALDTTTRKYIEKVSTAAKRMSGLIKDLLEYSRLAQPGLKYQKTDLNVILKSILTDFELLISQKEAVIEADNLPVIEAIPLQMNQLLYNLLGNALKFTKSNISPVISITSQLLTLNRKKELQLNLNKEYYEIKISDNGIGFNQDYADKIFTIFQTLNEKSSYGGYGIGLALCRKIAATHSGYIYAVGARQQGATFIIILPSQQ